MKVALVSFDFDEYATALANGLGWDDDVCLLLPEHYAPQVARLLDPTVTLATFAKPRLRQPLRQVGMCLELLRRVRRLDPDVVHVQQGHLWFNAALPFLRRPLVLTIHDHTHHPGDRLSRKTPQPAMTFGFRRADRVIVHGESLKHEVADRRGVARERIHVVPHVAVGNGILLPAGGGGEPVVLFFGRIWPYKGLDYLIRAEPLVTAEVPSARIVIAGTGEDLAPYRAAMVHPERFTIYDEFVSSERRAELFARASVVVLPYVEASQSGVVPVAYAFARPVVVTSVGALPEIVAHEETGLVVPPRDEVALADAIVRLLKDPALGRELGENGRRRLETELSPEAVARETRAVYELAVADRNGRRSA
jgi:glycosyltransferase involved in cell wall biosynthesis